MTDVIQRLRRAAAAIYLLEKHGISRTVNTLAKMAVVGGGPLIEYDGRIPLYRTDFLDDYARETLSPPVHSTSELRKVREDAPALT